VRLRERICSCLGSAAQDRAPLVGGQQGAPGRSYCCHDYPPIIRTAAPGVRGRQRSNELSR
jgi:hypothetical protein